MEPEKRQLNKIFVIAMFFGIAVFITSIYITSGKSVLTIFFHYQMDTDRFMDFFNCVYQSQDLKIYQTYGSIYPPLANLFYYLLHFLLPSEAFQEGHLALRSSAAGQRLYFVYAILTASLLLGLIYYLAKGTKRQRFLLATAIGCTAPFAFTLQRGNLLLLAVSFSLLFLAWYRSADKLKREMALISLALAFNLKFYPALLGLLLLKEKRWKESVRCALYAIVLFFAPLFLFGGREALEILIQSLTSTTSQFSSLGYGFKVNTSNTIAMAGSLLGDSGIYLTTIAQRYTYLLTLTAFLVFPFLQEEWKRIALLCVVIVAFPTFSFTYNLCYLFLPLLFFLNEKQAGDITKKDYFYLFLFVSALIYLPFSVAALEQMPGFSKPQLITVVSGISVLALEVTLIAEGFCQIAQRDVKTWKKSVLLLPPLLLLSAVTVKAVESQQIFSHQYREVLLPPVEQMLESESLSPEQTILLVRYNEMIYRSLQVKNPSQILASQYFMQENLRESDKIQAVTDAFFSAFKTRRGVLIERCLYDNWNTQYRLQDIGLDELFRLERETKNYLLFVPDDEKLRLATPEKEVTALLAYDGSWFEKGTAGWWTEKEGDTEGSPMKWMAEISADSSVAVEKHWLLSQLKQGTDPVAAIQPLFRHFVLLKETNRYYILRGRTAEEPFDFGIFAQPCSGFYGPEPGFRWSAQSSTQELFNLSSDAQLVHFKAVVLAPAAADNSTFTMRLQSAAEVTVTLNGDLPTTVELTAEVPPGHSLLYFETTAKRVYAPGDPRTTYFKLCSLEMNPVPVQGA